VTGLQRAAIPRRQDGNFSFGLVQPFFFSASMVGRHIFLQLLLSLSAVIACGVGVGVDQAIRSCLAFSPAFQINRCPVGALHGSHL
jgi:hypothetical protein